MSPIHRSYDPGWFSSHGIVEGLRSVERGEQQTVTFAIAPHPATCDTPDAPAKFVTIGRETVDGRSTWRFCGGDDGRDPGGVNSHSLVPSWQEQDLAFAAASLSIYLQRNCKTNWAIYRQPEAAAEAVAA